MEEEYGLLPYKKSSIDPTKIDRLVRPCVRHISANRLNGGIRATLLLNVPERSLLQSLSNWNCRFVENVRLLLNQKLSAEILIKIRLKSFESVFFF